MFRWSVPIAAHTPYMWNTTTMPKKRKPKRLLPGFGTWARSSPVNGVSKKLSGGRKRSPLFVAFNMKSLTIFRGDGTQKQSANAHPSYEDLPSSDYSITYIYGAVNLYRTMKQHKKNGQFHKKLTVLVRVSRFELEAS